MSGPDESNPWDDDVKTQVPGLNPNKNCDDILRSYLNESVPQDKLFAYLNKSLLNSNDSLTNDYQIREKSEALELSLGKLQKHIDCLDKHLNFDLDLIADVGLIEVHTDFVEKYMYALCLLDSLYEKVCEDFLALSHFAAKDVDILCEEWDFKTEEANSFIKEFLSEIQENINNVARKHISIGVRIMECIVLKSNNESKFQSLKTYLDFDGGSIKRKKDTLEMEKIGKIRRVKRTTENFIVHTEEDGIIIVKNNVPITERPTKPFAKVTKKLKKQDCPLAADSSQLPSPFATDKQTTRKIEQFSLDELTA